MIRIVPKPGAPIRHPVTRELLPAGGILVDRVDAHWRRREREGGVTITNESVPTDRTPEQLGAPPNEE